MSLGIVVESVVTWQEPLLFNLIGALQQKTNRESS
nr:MAG TPA: hypothetical protein [Bacteriophage sp.]